MLSLKAWRTRKIQVTTKSFSDFFSDPYDISASFQLSARLMGADKCRWISRIRDADDALTRGKSRLFLRLIKPVISFLNNKQQRQIIRRTVYNHIFLRAFDPLVFSLPTGVSEGRFVLGSQPSRHLEFSVSFDTLRKGLVKTTRAQFHKLYGADISRSLLALRYAKLEQPEDILESQMRTAEDVETLAKHSNPSFLHLDEKKGITTIVYLSDVSAANGAFRYVEGSHEAPISPTLKAFHEFVLNDMKITKHEGVMNLPSEFRAGINYYFWLEPEKQSVIDRFTKIVEGPAGTAITFAGNRLLHGGGTPYLGERDALFIQHVGILLHRIRQLLHPVYILQATGYSP